MQHFQVIVIGAGSGGLTAAVGLSKIGKRVLLVERDLIGGECTNSGCIPSKALLHHAKSYAAAVAISGTNGNTENFRREAFTYVREKIAETLATETPEHFTTLGITVVRGEALFSGPRSLTVQGEEYRFKQAIIATGSRPRLIDVPGLAPDDTLTNQNLFTQTDVPKRTLIIGGGPVGLEMGQALALLGSQVTIIDSDDRLAKRADPSIGAVLHTAFATLGITFIGNAAMTSVTHKVATVTSGNEGAPALVPFDKVLIAIGRVPHLPPGLVSAGIASTECGVTVNHNYQTTNTRVYALGDVADRFKFTHQADDVARQVVTRIATHGLTSVKTKALPQVTYTDPELAQVGLTETAATQVYGQKYLHRIAVPFILNDRARTDNATGGVLVVIVKRITGKIVGAHIAGAHAGELIAPFTLAIDNNLSLWKLRRSIYAYPTYSGLTKTAGDLFFATQVSTLRGDLARMTLRTLPKALVVLLWLFGLAALYHYHLRHYLTVADTSLAVFMFITATAWGPLLYILAYTIRPLTFLPGTILTILSGVFFGLWGGIVFTIIGANLSAAVAYLIGRFFSTQNQTSSATRIGRFTAALRKNPFSTVLTLRFLYLPFDAVNYSAGLLRLPFLPYALATFIGTLLGIITFVAVGASLSVTEVRAHGLTANAINGTFLLLSVVIFITSLGIARLLKRH